ncbi:MAG TPA: DedA family protein [Pyrinomonadaceae bacterium]|nr:DedA family protein [Pyrinomonadaceae bacterium]
MVAKLIEILSAFIVATISTLGYGGVVLLMAVESACIPLPSEIIMPFSGYLVYKGQFNLWWVGVAGAFGCVLGSWVAYYVGLYGGRPVIEKYGRYVLLSRHDLDLADRWFARYGEAIVFFSRLLPVVRTFIAFPAGVARMSLTRFTVYTFLGSLPWCVGLAYVGQVLGEQWDKSETLKTWFHRFDFLIGAVILAGAVWWVWRHFKHSRPQDDDAHAAARTRAD